MSRPGPTIVVIGGGFSGTAVAANLLRRGRAARVLLVNRYGPIGRGVAYGTRLEAHVLNVPAGGMSGLEDDPEHFLPWARLRDPATAPGTFVSRRIYGEYLSHLLEQAQRDTPANGVLDRVVGEVRDIAVRPDGSGATLSFADGSRREAIGSSSRSGTIRPPIRLPREPSSMRPTGTCVIRVSADPSS